MRAGMRTSVLGALAVGVAGAVLATGGAAVTPTVKSASNTALGTTILVGATGRTVYHYTDDHGKNVDCKGACLKTWPPVLVAKSAKPVAGPGLKTSKLGTITRPDGTVQVTYNGYALYRFSGDAKNGDVNGQGLEHSWYAIAPSGALVKVAPAASGGVSSSSGSGSSDGSGSADGGGTTGGGYGPGGY